MVATGGSIRCTMGTMIAVEANGSSEDEILRLRTLIDSTPALIHTARPDGYLDFFNRTWMDFAGCSLEELLGWGWVSRIHPEDVDAFVRKWRESVAGGDRIEQESRVLRADGEYRWMIHLAAPQRDADGKVVKWFGSSIDIEDRKRAEEALRQSEAYLAEGQRLTHTGSWAFDVASDRYIYASDENARIFGFVPGETLPTREEDFRRMLPEDVAEVEASFQKAIREKVDTEFEYRIVLPDGAVRHIHAVRHPVLNSAREVVQLVGTSMDITERKHAEEAIRQREKELRDVIQAMPSIAMTIHRDGTVEFVNQRWQEFTGMSMEDSIGSGWHRAIHPQDLDGYLKKKRAALAGGDPYEGEVRIRGGATGEYRWFLSRVVPLHDERGEILKWYGTVTDIDDRKLAEERLQHENVFLREEIDKSSMFEEIVGSSAALRHVLSRIAKVAPTDSTVLITGETGTGKELVARAIHKRSRRSSNAFVSINCSSIPRDLIASELFGHEKGAFTGATQRRLGRFEMADGGTIFLDEVGDLPGETQVALLRVLQEREFERVGGNRAIRCDVRVIAATNRDLQSAIESGAFRSDLFYRLNVFPVETPPLRNRPEDIPLLVTYFIDRYARKSGKVIRHISKKSLELLQSYPWPGNVRELQNVIERSVIVCESGTFSVDESWISSRSSAAGPKTPVALSLMLEKEEKQAIEAALRECRGRVAGDSGAAVKLNVPRSTLESRIRALKIDKNRFKVLQTD